MLSASFLDIFYAIYSGVVLNASPLICLPSLRVIVISFFSADSMILSYS